MPILSKKQRLDNNMASFSTMSALRISLASPEQIRAWSSGEVTVAETINYRTLKPERDGLFCERIFGPTKNWQCACGRYKKARYKGKVCDVCGVQVAPARVRRERMGHIELAAPVSHVWYAHNSPSRMALLLDMAPNQLEQVLAYTSYIVLTINEEARSQEIQRIEAQIERWNAQGKDGEHEDMSDLPPPENLERESSHIQRGEKASTISLIAASVASLKELDEIRADRACEDEPSDEELRAIEEGGEEEPMPGRQRKEVLRQILDDLMMVKRLTLLDIARYQRLKQECGHVVRAGIGAEAIRELLGELKLDTLAETLRQEISEGEGATRSKASKRLQLVEALRRSRTNPQWMILSVIPVLPAGLRPVLQLQGGRFASSDVNELYSRVIYRNNRLKRFLADSAPELMIYHEKAALQAACDALFDNGHCARPLRGSQGQALQSLSEALSGKGGRFRHSLLGKRVDYSGRSVISVGLDLKLHQCGLPKKIALELFKPFIIHKLVAYDFASTPRQAKRMVERRDPEVWDILEEVMQGRCVLLNRAPTLHRMSIQAFEPVLVEGNAIRLHPQVCSAFNADFDGDQMAVHLPLSDVAQREAREIMLSTRNLLSPASGEPTISVSQEMVLGCFYLTQDRPNKKGQGRVFADPDEALLAYAHGIIDLQARIIVRMPTIEVFMEPGQAEACGKNARLSTTVGRILFNNVLPEGLRFRNYAMKKDFLKLLVWDCIKCYGPERAAEMADTIKRLGFQQATRAGISFAASDVTVPPQKREILVRTDELINTVREQWEGGLITREEQYQQNIAIWTEATDQIAKHVQDVLDPYGSIATIASSGATKAKLQQIRQLSGMRGLMASPSGAVIETPVRGNFLEGLAVAEYFLSSHGARKSLMDRSLNTARSGYLTIRLVNVAQDVIVTEEDCGTTEGLLITDEESRGMGLADSGTRLFARVLMEVLPQVQLSAGDILDEAAVERIRRAGIMQVRVRSVLHCQARRGVCRQCYGWDLAKRALVQRGVAVGIIAAQSIGEPGTQLTMRTFHSGGIAGGQGDITQGLPRAEEVFEAQVPKDAAVLSEIEGEISRVTKDEKSGTQSICITARKAVVEDYMLPEGSTVLAGDKSMVQEGQIIALRPTSAGYAMSKRAIRARTAGQLSFVGIERLTISGEKVDEREYNCPPRGKLLMSVGQRVQAGQPLTTGPLNPLELLSYRGREAVERYILQEAQQVYRTTGAYIHDKHFEIIIRQMLRYARVENPGDSGYLPDELMDRFNLAARNRQIIAEGGEPVSARPVLLGLTRATLAAESWLATAAFQQTSRVLTDAALAGKADLLVGLKENVIIGRRIPAGTGLLPVPEPPRKRPPKKLARRGDV